MKRTVVKFGGSNLKSADDINNIVNAVKSYKHPPIIVVSAFFGITDKLIAELQKSVSGNHYSGKFIETINKLHKDALLHFVSNKEILKEALHTLDERTARLKKLFTGVGYISEASPSIKDEILSYGERLSSLVLASVLKAHKIKCEEALPENIGLITDGEFENASVNYVLSAKNLKKSFKDDRVYVVPGFYGVSCQGKTTLLGRGGSDYAAASIARCVDASSLDIWKDVDGFQTADPKLVHDAATISRLNYTEAAELAYFGAKILHPRTVEPLTEVNIPIRILNISKAGRSKKPLTVIDSTIKINSQVVKSVTSSDDFCALQYTGPGVGITPGLMAQITRKLDDSHINIKLIFNSHTRINLFLSNDDVHRAYDILKGLKLKGVGKINISNQLSTIAVVGCGMTEKSGVAAKLFSAVAKAGINVKTISSGASDVCTYFIVDKVEKDKAIKVIHHEFFSK